MESLIHLIFTVIKVAILASVYAGMVVLIIKFIALFINKNKWFYIVSKHKYLWLKTGFTISISLYVWLFSHWGFHGFGDYSTLPLNHGVSIEEINSTNVFSSDLDLSEIKTFAFNKSYVTGLCKGQFFISNLRNKETIYCNTVEYVEFSKTRSLPNRYSFRTFREHYADYWSGWRFWLLA